MCVWVELLVLNGSAARGDGLLPLHVRTGGHGAVNLVTGVNFIRLGVVAVMLLDGISLLGLSGLFLKRRLEGAWASVGRAVATSVVVCPATKLQLSRLVFTP